MTKLVVLLSVLVLVLLSAMSPAQVPFINLPLVPDATAPGGATFTLTVNGTGFVATSVVNWNGSPLATQFVSGSELTATVPAADIATRSTASVTVVNPGPGGRTSNVEFFTVTPSVGNKVGFGLAATVTGPEPVSLAVGDFNGDGKLDLVVTNWYGPVSVYLGDGTGNFKQTWSWTGAPRIASVVVGDFNGDGKPDLAIVNVDAFTVSIMLGDGTGNFTLASSPAVGSYPYSAAVGDFNGDGKLDLAVTGSSTTSILLGDGTGNFNLASSVATPGSWQSMGVGDFNGDGNLDLVVTSWSPQILLGDGTGNFASGPPLPADGYLVAVGDFNGDGKLDLAMAEAETVFILLGDGSGNFTQASTLPGVDVYALAVGDFNGDGYLDLAVGDANVGTVSIWLGNGTGTFTLASFPPASYTPSSLAVGDFNGDGQLDFAVANWSTVSIALQGTPTATLSPTGISFGTQLLNTTSTSQIVTLTNSGGAALNITKIAATASFAEKNNCGRTLGVGTSCTIHVVFTPHRIGPLTSTVTISDNAFASPQTISLTGVGTVVTLLPTSLDFGNQPVGTTSLPQAVTLTNYGNTTLSISGIHLSGNNPGAFAQANTCGTVVPAQGSCTISVTFTPQYNGQKTATLSVGDNGGASPQTVTLTGAGT